MNVRPATSDDRERIRAIAHDSLRSSYSLSPAQIETILVSAFDEASLGALLDDADSVVFVADETVDGDRAVRGFVTVDVDAKPTIRWLHVDPAARGGGAATALVERVHERFVDRPVAACILDAAVEGGEFLKGFGLKRSHNDRIPIGGEEFDVTVFTEGESTETSTDPSVAVPDSISIDGADRFVDGADDVPGREAPFFPVYSAPEETDPYGYFCSQCGSTDVSIDGQDRLECGNCGNTHLADEWDDAYL